MLANSKKFVTLESRLADLLLAEFQINFSTGEINWSEFPNVIANTRNYYIHYDEKLKSKHKILTEEELSIYNTCLLILLDYYIYSELGFLDHQELLKKLNYRWGDIDNVISRQKAFKSKH
ncbi:HEPN domain-containing protein [Streptococcus uberis]|uniref:HEPN domain-containing protein n=1 Tax=Streptococcus uberis TaxID=1349 RepID=UPI0037AA9F31